MPKYKKKKYTRRRRKRRGYNRVNISRAPVPRSTMVKFRYNDDASINGGAGIPGVHLWSANSLYDPNFSSLGHQPCAADQWYNFYDHYTVVGAKIIAQFMPPSTSQGDNFICGIYVDDNSVPNNQYHGIQEQSESNWKLMSGNGDGPVTVTKKLSMKKFFNNKSLLSTKELSGILGDFGTGSSPSEQVYFGTYVKGETVSTDPPAVHVHVQIEYIAVLHEPKNLLQS